MGNDFSASNPRKGGGSRRGTRGTFHHESINSASVPFCLCSRRVCSGIWCIAVEADCSLTVFRALRLCLLQRTRISDKSGQKAKAVEEKPNKHVRVEPETPSAANQGKTNPPNKKDDENKRRVVTMEPSVHTFAGTSSNRRDRSDPVMITDALADVRVK